MGFHNLNDSAKLIFWGNVLLIICCAFYLAWWLMAFKPTGAIKGIRTGWLLIPAVIAGLAAVYLAVKGLASEAVGAVVLPGRYIIFGGIAVYLILLVVTGMLLKRQVTSELFLIVGWAVLALSEINILYGMEYFSVPQAVGFVIATGAAVIISIICYILYYKLGARAGYLDGMVPLLLAALVAAGISVALVV